MSTALAELHCLETPSVPQRGVRRATLAGDPSRVAAIVFDIDALFDPEQYETARARATARVVAERRGGDSLWLEILAVQMARQEGGRRATEALQTLVGDDTPVLLPSPALEQLRPDHGVETALEELHRRFKLAVVSTRSQSDTTRILTALGLYEKFDAGAFGDQVTVSERAAALLGEPDHSCLVVAPNGSPILAAARLNGMRTATLRRDATATDFADPDLVIGDVDTLTDLPRPDGAGRDALL